MIATHNKGQEPQKGGLVDLLSRLPARTLRCGAAAVGVTVVTRTGEPSTI
jgi:hypothetical protein